MRSSRLVPVLTVLLVALALTVAAFGSDRRTATLEKGAALLEGVALEATTPIAEINADPEAFDGKVVQVEGTVVEICSSMGCWVELRDDHDNAITVKVDDGVVDLRELVTEAQYMVAEGVFQVDGEHGAQVYIMKHGAVVAD
jgi:hypothetical protein